MNAALSSLTVNPFGRRVAGGADYSGGLSYYATNSRLGGSRPESTAAFFMPALMAGVRRIARKGKKSACPSQVISSRHQCGMISPAFGACNANLGAIMTALITLDDLNPTVNHEPRIADLRLAEALGFKQPRQIRELIERHRESLAKLGPIVETTTPATERGGRPGKMLWLNRKQALFTCTKSETLFATEVTLNVVEVYDSVTGRGALPHGVAPKTVTVHEHTRHKPTKRDMLALGVVMDIADGFQRRLAQTHGLKLPGAPHMAGDLKALVLHCLKQVEAGEAPSEVGKNALMVGGMLAHAMINPAFRESWVLLHPQDEASVPPLPTRRSA